MRAIIRADAATVRRHALLMHGRRLANTYSPKDLIEACLSHIDLRIGDAVRVKTRTTSGRSKWLGARLTGFEGRGNRTLLVILLEGGDAKKYTFYEMCCMLENCCMKPAVTSLRAPMCRMQLRCKPSKQEGFVWCKLCLGMQL